MLGQYHIPTIRVIQIMSDYGWASIAESGPSISQHYFDVDKRRFLLKSYMTTTGCALREYGSPNVFRNVRLQQGEL